ncbi:carbamate kinase [Yangia mangrovi]|uniref:Carbamate kinase n=1 Tax=Alloyangia mangrovi TaxID=1779329 RepID=A0A2A3JYF7_9RHOB|nr:carbamate kinase [Alloyangia mangrovi]MCA0940082.1 carbamate kinase [Alloyangia pacifica]MCA0945751.1 carbamate kinase [Alloyangia pacifica]MCT4370490.1 carbamate kinase [Alloyangia mangrovi]
MRIVVALGGNALLRRGQALTAENQRENVRVAAEALAPLAEGNELVITHGNGPQVGLLALQEAAYTEVDEYPLDVLVGETMGMIGYMIEQEMGNLLPFETPLATVLTMVEVDPADPAFDNPTKFIGPVYEEAEAKKNAEEKGWAIKPDGDMWRRVVPSPEPKRIFEVRPIRWMLENGAVVIAAGGGGIPTMYDRERHLTGVECVIDKDFCSSLLATEIEADVFVVATDADAVFLDWGTPDQTAIRKASPDMMDSYDFPAGSMGPKVSAAQKFARASGGRAVICALADIGAALRGETGTTISSDVTEIELVRG